MFGSSDDPFGGGDDPFAASAPSGGDDPFGGAGSDDPFADVGPAPTGPDSDDPFADISAQSGAMPADPFAGDPFGDSTVMTDAPSEIFGADDPFGSADFTGEAGGGPDPTASVLGGPDQTGGLEELDFSALSGDGGGDPFSGTGTGTDAVFTDSFVGEMPGADASDGGGGGLFDVDRDDVGGGPSAMGSAPAASPRSDAAQAAARRRRRKAQKGRRGKKAKGSANKNQVMMIAGVVVLGVGLGQTDMGYFGMNLLFGDDGAKQPKPTLGQKKLGEDGANGGKATEATKAPSLKGDAPSDYTKRIGELKKKLELAKGRASPEVRGELVQLLMRLQERYPDVYKSNPEYAKLRKEHLTPQDLETNKKLLVQKLLAEGKDEDAAEALEAYQAQLVSDPDDLYLMARVALSKENRERAKAFYERCVAQAPEYSTCRFDLSQMLLEDEDMPGARQHLEQLLETNPTHSGAHLSMAQISLYEKNYEAAKGFINESTKLAKDTRNGTQQFQAYQLKASLAEAEGKLEDKRIALERALELKPKDEPTALDLGQLLVRQERNIEALRVLKACQQNGCKSAPFFSALVETYKLNGQTDDAQSQLNEALRNHPNDTALLMLHAENERGQEHYKTAKAIYATIIENEPSTMAAYLKLSALQLREGKQSEALETLRTGVDRVDEKLPILEKLAELQMKVGATLKAKETMGEILKLDPNNTDVKLRFAKVLQGLGFAEEAVRYYHDLRTLGALQGEELLDYAEALHELRRLDEAMGQVEAVLATDPLNLRANVLSGAIHSAKDDFKRADEDLRRALKVDPESSSAFYYLGRNEMAQERMAPAVEYLSKAGDLDPDNLDIRYHLALAFSEVGGVDNLRAAKVQYTFIIEEYTKYTSNLEKKKIDPEVYLRRGRLFFDNGEFQPALKDFKQAMLLDPVRQDLVIEFARTLHTMNKRREATIYLEEVLTRDPKNPAAHFHLGEIALKSSDKRRAEDHLKQAIAAGGANFPVAHRHLGFLYKEKGLVALACNAFKEYLRVAPKSAYDRDEVQSLVSRLCRR